MLRIPLCITMASTVLAGCAVGPDYHHPEVALTGSYRGAVAIDPGPDAEWWARFHDPELETVIVRVAAQNLDLAQAGARLDQARAAAGRAGADLLPRLGAEASASTTRQSFEAPLGRIADAVGAPRSYNDYALGTEASWEIDLFGALRREREAAVAEAQAAGDEHAAAQISLTAEAADAYLALRGLQAERDIARSQEATEVHLVELVQLRFAQGVSADRDLQRARADLEGVRARIPPLEAAIEGQLDRLDYLMGAQAGTYHDELAAAGVQAEAPWPRGSTAPSELLRRRPDIVAAERRLAAASARIGAAIAGYYPSVSLGGVFGYDSMDAGQLLTGTALGAQALVGLRWRIFDFGRVDAEVAAARGKEAEMLAAYRAAVLRATSDVESSLSRLAESHEEAQALQRQLDALAVARRETEIAYQAGAAALIDVLDADRELLAATDRLAIARANQGRSAVASYRALGGGWAGG